MRSSWAITETRSSGLVHELIDKLRDETNHHLNYLSLMEKTPFTVNERYFSDAREKLVADYKARRSKIYTSYSQATSKPSNLHTALSALHDAGHTQYTEEDVERLRPTDPWIVELELVAEVRGYLQVRFLVVW